MKLRIGKFSDPTHFHSYFLEGKCLRVGGIDSFMGELLFGSYAMEKLNNLSLHFERYIKMCMTF